jgi:anthranilate synthase/aminodeoxychorismate synthase-like glutamine amidotransferase
MKVLLLDNYDSFTYNLAQYLGELGHAPAVHRNDAISLGEVESMKPDRIVISPGPGRPEDAGITIDVIRQWGRRVPVLGVCLGHQGIGHAFGGEVVRAPVLMHGKVSSVQHDGRGIFAGVAQPFVAGRYHSLIVADPPPEALEISARTDDGIIMGLRHREWPVHGVQFHPESVLTGEGMKILRNFLELPCSPS